MAKLINNNKLLNMKYFTSDDDEEEGSEIEGHERHEFGDHAGHGNAGGSAINDDYLFLHLDEPRQGTPTKRDEPE